MAWPRVFAALTSPVLLSYLDDNFNALAAICTIPCTASGSNTVLLTPVTNAPTFASYTTGNRFLWKQAASSTAAVTLNFNSIGGRKLFFNDGTTQVTGQLLINQWYDVVFDAALDSAAGGFSLPYFFPPGSTGQVLTWNTSGPPTYQAAPGGGLTQLTTTTAVGGTTTMSDITSITSTYNDYFITFDSLVPAANNGQYTLLVTTDGGSTWKSTTYLSDCYTEPGNAATQFQVNGTAGIMLTDTAANSRAAFSGAAYGLYGYAFLFGANSGSRKNFLGEACGMMNTSVSTANWGRRRFHGYWDGGNNVINGVQISCTQNINAGGKMRVYGMSS